MSEYKVIQIAEIATSLTNPRKTFNPIKLKELAESIKATGVHQPILVRPLPASRVEDTSIDLATGKPRAIRPAYEIVAGERRFRASKDAGQELIPTIVRELSDDQVLEIQIVENLQRDDLTELEEAEGYEQLMQHSGIRADQICKKIGKSKSYVYSRLKLLDLTHECKTAMREEKLDSSRAILIARIPDSKLQLKALEEALKLEWDGSQKNVKAFQRWLQENVMLKLEHAVFKITDARLIESAGSCKDCNKRTGSDPDLFADVGNADICTDPICFNQKEEAHHAQLLQRAKAKGMTIVEGKEAMAMLDGKAHLNKPGNYVDLSEKRPDLCAEGDRPSTLGQLLGKDAPAPILFVHPRTQEVAELVPKDEVNAVLLAKGLTQNATKLSQSADPTADLKKLQDKLSKDTQKFSNEALVQAVADAIRATTTEQAKKLLTGDFLREFLLTELRTGELDTLEKACSYRFSDDEDAEVLMSGHINRLGDTDILRVTACFLVYRQLSWNAHSTEELQLSVAMAKKLDIDNGSISKKAATQIKAKYAKEIKAIQERIESKNPKSQEKPKGRNVKKSTPKLSAEKAQQEIAVAMQQADEEMLNQARELIKTEQRASVRFLKEKLRIGSEKAMAILESLEAAGVVSAIDDAGSRKVLEPAS